MSHRYDPPPRFHRGARSGPPLRADIEGLRAVAVVLVVLFHLGVPGMASGFAGVDVFFVISGFLITSHLLREMETTGGGPRLGQFYARRARRLLPAACVVLVFTAVAGYLVLPPTGRADLVTDVVTSALYVVNWALAARSVDYLAENADVSPLQHYWSLAVEEQFYLVIPLLLLALGGLARRRGLSVRAVTGWVVLALVLASLAWSVWRTAVAPQTAYFVTTTRVWELGVGSLLAVVVPLVRPMPRAVAEGLSLIGAGLLVWTVLSVTTATPWPGTAALLPVLGAAALLAAGSHSRGTVLGRALGVRPLAWVGGHSYAIYLWHWPLIVLATAQGWTGPAAGPALVALTLVLAWATRLLVEDPIRFGPALRARPWRTPVAAGVAMALPVAAAAAVWTTVPSVGQRPAAAVGADALAPVDEPGSAGNAGNATAAPQRGARTGAQLGAGRLTSPQPPQVFATSGAVFPAPEAAPENVPAYYADGCQASEEETEPDLDCVYGDPDSDTVVAVVGDSKMGQWLTPLTAIAEREGWRLETYLKSACGLNPAEADRYPECAEYGEAVMTHLTAQPGRVDLVIGSMGRSADERQPDGGAQEKYVRGHVQSWERLQQAGAEVLALADTPHPATGDGLDGADSVYECVATHRDDWSACTFPRNPGRGTPALLAAAKRLPSVDVIDLNPWICPTAQCPPVIGGTLVYRQGSHLTDAYAVSLQPRLHQALVDAGVATGPVRPAPDRG